MQFKPNKSSLSLYSLYYAEACNKFAGAISASLRTGNTAPFKEMLEQWRAVGNTVPNTTGLRFEPQTSAPETNALPFDQPAGLKFYDLTLSLPPLTCRNTKFYPSFLHRFFAFWQQW